MDEQNELTRPPARAPGKTGGSCGSGPPGVGDTFGGRYLIIERLAVGANGCVYRAKDLQLGREVALKLLQWVPAGEQGERDRAEAAAAEAQVVARLEHPNIVPIHDAGEIDGIPFLAMALVRGRSLAEVLDEEGSLEPWRAVAIIRQVCGALDHAHGHGVLHRDVKPANIILEDGDRAQLVDFGLACMRDEASKPGNGDVAGTMGYMAPEVLSGAPPSPRSDLFAAAAVLYKMLVGRRPFEGTTEKEVAGRILEEDPPAPHTLRKGIPRGMDRVLSKALARLPEERFPTGASLVRALDRVRRARRLWAAAAAALLVLVVGGGAFWGWWAMRPLEVDAEVWAEARTTGGKFAPVAVRDDTVLRAGDRLWVSDLRANRKAFVHLILLDSDGRLHPIFPSEAIPVGLPLEGGRDYQIPPGERWVLDERAGPEAIFLAASPDEVPLAHVQDLLGSAGQEVARIARAGPIQLRGLTDPVASPALRLQQEDEVERLLRERFPVVQRYRFIHE